MKSTFSEIKSLIDRLAAKINVPKEQLPTYGSSIGDGTPCIDIGVDGTVYFVVTERGTEFERWLPQTMDDLLYRVIEGATWSMASQYELKHRIKGQDNRRISFAYQEELLGILNKDWRFRAFEKHTEILKKYPFDDHASERVDYLLVLKSKGMEHYEAWALACEKYPLPYVNS